jgi:hypothetical protein
MSLRHAAKRVPPPAGAIVSPPAPLTAPLPDLVIWHGAHQLPSGPTTEISYCCTSESRTSTPCSGWRMASRWSTRALVFQCSNSRIRPVSSRAGRPSRRQGHNGRPHYAM